MEKTMNPRYTHSHKNIHIGSRLRHTPDEIILLLADINYTQIFFVNGQKIIVATTLKILENRLASTKTFFRPHKSALINIKYIKKYLPDHSDEFIEMKNDYRVAISRRRKMAFKLRMEEMNS